MTSAREHFKIKNTLVCLLKAIEGKRTQVELRNENVIVGTIRYCDGFMNLNMENVIFKPVKGGELKFTDFYVQGKQIRYVHIPDEIDMIKAMEQHVKRCYVPRQMRARRGGKERGGARGTGRGRGDCSTQESLKRGGFVFGQGSRGRASRGDPRR